MVKQWLQQLKQMASLEEKKKAYIAKQGHPFKRKITHTKYPDKFENVKTGGWSRKLRLEITDQSMVEVKKEEIDQKVFNYVDDYFLDITIGQRVLPIWGGRGFSYFIYICIFCFFNFFRRD